MLDGAVHVKVYLNVSSIKLSRCSRCLGRIFRTADACAGALLGRQDALANRPREVKASGLMQIRFYWFLLLAVLGLSTAGCGSFVAHRMAQAPNTYPTWFAPKPR